MPDREKVIKGLECHKNAFCEDERMQVCPYWQDAYCSQKLSADAFILVKELQEEIQNLRKENNSILTQFYEWAKQQKAVVHPEPSCEMTYITDCCCDLCGVQLIREDNFCRCCGKRIEWKGGEQE